MRDRLLVLLETLYDAPGDFGRWQAFLSALCADLNGTAASFISHDLIARTGSVAVTARVDPSATQEYLDHWIHVDPWAHSPKSRSLTAGSVVLGDQIISRRALTRTAFYNDFSRRYDIAQSIVAVIESGANALSGLSINASSRRTPFGTDDVALLDALMPHLQRALQLHRRMAGVEATAQQIRDALDRTSHAVIVLDGQGRVIHTNNAADALLGAHDGLTIDRGELRSSPLATTRLRTLIAGAIDTSRGVGLHAGGHLLIDRPTGRQALRVVVSPVCGNRDALRPISAAAIVFVTDPERRPLLSEGEIRVLFGLTPAEARLTRALAEGLDLARSAQRLGVSVSTLRTRLKSVFDKTGIRRQADLVRSVSDWPLPPDDRTSASGVRGQ